MPALTQCSWFHSCTIASLDIASGFLSAPVANAPLSTRLEWKPKAGLPEVWVHTADEQLTPALEEATEDEIWLALGVVTAPNFTATAHHSLLRHQSPAASRRARPPIAWQYVVTDERHRDDARFAVVPCRDGRRFNLNAALMCKVHYWFLHALKHFPAAKFIGKLEDDTVVHDVRVLAELQHAHARHPAESARIWYSFFMWGQYYGETHDDGFCGDGDMQLLRERPICHAPRPLLHHANWTSERVIHEAVAGTSTRAEKEGAAAGAFRRVDVSPHDAVRRRAPFTGAAPFATGAIDIRSRALAQSIGLCEHAWAFVHETWAGGHEGCERRDEPCSFDSWTIAGDGFQGFLNAMCNDWQRHNVTAYHLTWAKFESYSSRSGMNPHASVMHNYKDWRGNNKRESEWGRHLPHGWVWNLGEAMLPFEFTLYRTKAGGIGWVPRDADAMRAWKQLPREGKAVGWQSVPSCAKLRAANLSLACAAVPAAYRN